MLAACCLVAIVALVIVVAQRGPAPALVGLGLAVLPIPLLVVLILYLDRLEPEPRALLAAMFGAGAGIAVITLLLGRAFGTGAITPPELGPHAGQVVGVTVGAAIGGALVAQTLNGIVLLALLASRRTEIDGAHDGVVYASMTGLGFALVANLYAYSEAWNAGASALVEEFARHGIFGPLFQALFTSMIGLGVAYAASRRSGGYLAIAAGWVAAVALDALWNHSVGRPRHRSPGDLLHPRRRRDRRDRRRGHRPAARGRHDHHVPARLRASGSGHGDRRAACSPACGCAGSAGSGRG